MKNKVNNILHKAVLFLSMIAATGFIIGCDEHELPQANSIPDTSFPEANFSYTADQIDFKTIFFTNLSTEAPFSLWDFGGGNTSEAQDPTFFFEDGEGTYPVTLTASDANGISSSITMDVVVVDELIPVFECPSFECSDRSVWSSDGMSSTFSGSGSPSPPDGSTGAKLSSSSQHLDQTILVRSNTMYEISFWYVSASSSGTSSGELLIEDADNGDDFLDVTVPLSSTTSAYEQISYTIETGSATQNMRFYYTYGDVEVRLDLVEIVKL